MKIAFVGTECTGKTTLSKMLAKELGLPHVPDPYQKAISYSGISPDAWLPGNPQDNWAFEQAMHKAQFELEAGLESFVADSASLVRAACGLYLCGQNAPEQALADLVETSFQHCSTYSLLIHLYPCVEYKNNGHRLFNKCVRAGIATMLKGMISDLRYNQYITPIKIIDVTPQADSNRTIEIIKQHIAIMRIV